ncbi:MAG: hypothetical protein C4339_02925 [Nitrososphaerota archaeon]
MSSQQLLEQVGRYLVKALPKRDPIVIKRAQGFLIEDVDGRVYVDLFSGIAVNNVGHCHPEVVRAVVEQAQRYMHVSAYYHHELELELAKEVLELLPSGLARLFYCNSGTEAVDGAVKFCKKLASAQGRLGAALISLRGSFHGRLSLTLSLTGQRRYKAKLGNYANFPGVVHGPCPYYYRYGGEEGEAEFGKRCAEEVGQLIDQFAPGDVAAVIAEPILGEGGIIVPPDTFLPRLRRVCSERGVPLIADEVQTGFGRTGRPFACQLWDVEPDAMAMAKALGGGLPLGAIAVTQNIDDALEPGDHFNTFFANPVACAAAIASLRVIKRERLWERAERIGSFMMARLREAQAGLSYVGDVRGKGLMIGVELVKDRRTKEPHPEAAERVKELMRSNGYLVGVGGLFRNVLRLQPPLILDEATAERAVERLIACIRQLQG